MRWVFRRIAFSSFAGPAIAVSRRDGNVLEGREGDDPVKETARGHVAAGPEHTIKNEGLCSSRH